VWDVMQAARVRTFSLPDPFARGYPLVRLLLKPRQGSRPYRRYFLHFCETGTLTCSPVLK
jgi:hypothetical protein